MGNFKVRVNNEAESKEAQELFFKSGGKWCLGGCKIKNTDEPYLYLENGLVLHGSSAETFNTEQHKEITLPELRDMVKPSLNDQYAEIEQVRQAIKVPDGNDSNHTADAMAYAFMGVGREKAHQHRHYFIDVSDVSEIDFYEIALRYNVTDPCIQHILKKCLAVGQRGQKDFHHDLKDIYDTAKRMLDVHGLDS